MQSTLNRSASSKEKEDLNIAINEEHLERYPVLASFLKLVRDIKQARKTKKDVELQNTQLFSDVMNLASRNLIFFLHITGQDYLLWIIFKDEELTTQWMAFLDEGRQAGRIIQQEPIRRIKIQEIITAKDIPVESLFSWSYPASNLSNIAQLRHYSQELERITCDYHRQSIALYSNAIEANMSRFAQSVQVLQKNKHMNPRDIQYIQQIHDQYEAKKQEILSQPVQKKDGTFDLEAVKQQRIKMQELYKNSGISMHEIHAKYAGKNKLIREIFNEYERDRQQLEEKLHQMDEEFAIKTEPLIAKMEEALHNSCCETDSRLSQMIKLLSSCDIQQLPPEQQQAWTQNINQLKQHQEDLGGVKTLEQLQGVLVRCGDTMNSIDRLAKPFKSQEGFYTTLQSELGSFKKMVVDSGISILMNEEPDVADSISETASPTYETQQERHLSQEITTEEVRSQEKELSTKKHLLSQASAFTLFQSGEVQENNDAILTQKNMKAAIQQGRMGEVLNDDLVKGFIRGVLSQIKKLEQQNLTPDAKEMLQSVKNYFIELEDNPDYLNIVDKAQQIQGTLDDVSSNFGILEDERSQFSQLTQELESNSFYNKNNVI